MTWIRIQFLIEKLKTYADRDHHTDILRETIGIIYECSYIDKREKDNQSLSQDRSAKQSPLCPRPLVQYSTVGNILTKLEFAACTTHYIMYEYYDMLPNF